MFGSLSIEAQIREKLPKLPCSVTVFAGVIDTSQTRLSQGLSGVKSLPSAELLDALKTVNKMEAVAEMAYPLQLSWTDPQTIKKLLQDIDDGNLRILVQKNEPSTQEKAFAIRFRNGMFFARQENNEVLQTMNFLQGAMMTEAVAGELIKLLESLGHRGCTMVENRFDCDPIFELSQIWREESCSAVETGSEVSVTQ